MEFKDKEQRAIAIIIIDSKREIKSSDSIITYESEVINPLFTLGKYTADIGLSTLKENSPILRINNAFEFFASGDHEQWVAFELETKTQILMH